MTDDCVIRDRKDLKIIPKDEHKDIKNIERNPEKINEKPAQMMLYT